MKVVCDSTLINGHISSIWIGSAQSVSWYYFKLTKTREPACSVWRFSPGARDLHGSGRGRLESMASNVMRHATLRFNFPRCTAPSASVDRVGTDAGTDVWSRGGRMFFFPGLLHFPEILSVCCSFGCLFRGIEGHTGNHHVYSHAIEGHARKPD
jgi:hypothetical protein